MIKQIPTYGAAILTAMVIVRSATLEEESDISSLYQRNQDTEHVQDNMALRSIYEFEPNSASNLLAHHLKSPAQEVQPVLHENTNNMTFEPSQNNLEMDYIAELDEEIVEIILEDQALVEESGLSLDRESTINTRLSTLFPRQRIQPKPSSVALQE